jgi:hypothetical protein
MLDIPKTTRPASKPVLVVPSHVGDIPDSSTPTSVFEMVKLVDLIRCDVTSRDLKRP